MKLDKRYLKSLVAFVMRSRADGCTGLAAMIAYNFFLVVPSTLIFIVATMTFLPIENISQRLTDRFQKQGSSEAHSLIQTTLDRTFSEGRGWIFALSLLGTLYVMTNGYAGLISSLNHIYGLKETRPWVRVRLRALIMSSIAAVLIFVVFTLILLTPSIMDTLSENHWLSGRTSMLLNLFRWPATVALAALGIETTFRFAPNGGPRWRWLCPGTIFGAAAWLLSTRVFGYFVNNYGSYDRIYGSLATVIVLMTWIWISAMIFLLGAELNAIWQERRGGAAIHPTSSAETLPKLPDIRLGK